MRARASDEIPPRPPHGGFPRRCSGVHLIKYWARVSKSIWSQPDPTPANTCGLGGGRDASIRRSRSNRLLPCTNATERRRRDPAENERRAFKSIARKKTRSKYRSKGTRKIPSSRVGRWWSFLRDSFDWIQSTPVSNIGISHANCAVSLKRHRHVEGASRVKSASRTCVIAMRRLFPFKGAQ